MKNKKWVRLLAYVTGSVNQELLLQNEYLAATIRVKATSCFSQVPAIRPNSAAAPLSVTSDSEACSSSTAAPHE
jgi:hypothetical protein